VTPTRNSSSLPKISIITPSYNQAQFLEQTIKSVVDQGYPHLEYFIFDGGSTDGSVDIIKKYAKQYPKIIHWVSKKDKGQVDALNQGLKKATGDIVAYINSDDYYLPHTFLTVVDYFQRHPQKQWLAGGCQISDKRLVWSFTIKHLVPYGRFRFVHHLFDWLNQPAVFLKKDLVDQVGEFDPQYHQAFDYDYWLRCLRQAGLPGRLNQDLAVFRIHPQAKGSTNFDNQFKESYKIAQKYTDNPVWLAIHAFNRWLTISLYRLIK